MAAPSHERERVVAEAQQEAAAAHALQLAGALEVVGEGDRVHGEVLVEHLPHGEKHGAVGGEIEVIGLKVDQALLEGVRRDHHGREDRGLRLDVLGHGASVVDRHPGGVHVVVAHAWGLLLFLRPTILARAMVAPLRMRRTTAGFSRTTGVHALSETAVKG